MYPINGPILRTQLRRRRRALTLNNDAIMLSDPNSSYHLHMPASAFCASLRQSVKSSTKAFNLVNGSRTCTSINSKHGSEYDYQQKSLVKTYTIPGLTIPALLLTFGIHMRLLYEQFVYGAPSQPAAWETRLAEWNFSRYRYLGRAASSLIKLGQQQQSSEEIRRIQNDTRKI